MNYFNLESGINVLSLFDGISCGQLALKRAGIKVNNYFASEIDDPAINVAKYNFPNTKHIGDVKSIDFNILPKIDLLIGGSPCQSFSFSGKRNGMSTKDNIEILSLEHYLKLKEENFEFEGQSYLFWEYINVLKSVKPTYFLLENVYMSKKWEDIITEAIGIQPIKINSNLVSAQNRRRLYWTNIYSSPVGLFEDYLVCNIKQPDDKKIFLKDILETNIDEKYFLSKQRIETILKSNRRTNYLNKENLKSGCLIASYYKIPTDGQYIDETNNLECSIKFGRTDEAKEIRKKSKKETGKDWNPFNSKEIIDVDYNKMNTLTTSINKDNYILNPSKSYIRKLTPTECERLQTLDDGYTKICSDSQRYKMIGNGWTVDVISYIFSHL